MNLVVNNASGDVMQIWKDTVAQQARQGVRVSNATLNTTFPEFIQQNHIVIHSESWYDATYPNRYVIYKDDQSQDKLSSLFANVTISFY